MSSRLIQPLGSNHLSYQYDMNTNKDKHTLMGDEHLPLANSTKTIKSKQLDKSKDKVRDTTSLKLSHTSYIMATHRIKYLMHFVY